MSAGRIVRRSLLTGPLVLIASPAIALAIYKPSRVLVPQWFGVTCDRDGICLDDIARLDETRGLRREGLAIVSQALGAPRAVPRMVFCATTACSDRFGMPGAAAYNVGTVGMVVKPRGWTPYYVAHELIHHVQNERLGSLTMHLFRPVWWREGMAYELSGDPRDPIPVPVIECWRAQFRVWFAHRPPSDLWHGEVPDVMDAGASPHCKAGTSPPSS